MHTRRTRHRCTHHPVTTTRDDHGQIMTIRSPSSTTTIHQKHEGSSYYPMMRCCQCRGKRDNERKKEGQNNNKTRPQRNTSSHQHRCAKSKIPLRSCMQTTKYVRSEVEEKKQAGAAITTSTLHSLSATIDATRMMV